MSLMRSRLVARLPASYAAPRQAPRTPRAPSFSPRFFFFLKCVCVVYVGGKVKRNARAAAGGSGSKSRRTGSPRPKPSRAPKMVTTQPGAGRSTQAWERARPASSSRDSRSSPAVTVTPSLPHLRRRHVRAATAAVPLGEPAPPPSSRRAAAPRALTGSRANQTQGTGERGGVGNRNFGPVGDSSTFPSILLAGWSAHSPLFPPPHLPRPHLSPTLAPPSGKKRVEVGAGVRGGRCGWKSREAEGKRDGD